MTKERRFDGFVEEWVSPVGMMAICPSELAEEVAASALEMHPWCSPLYFDHRELAKSSTPGVAEAANAAEALRVRQSQTNLTKPPPGYD